MSTSSELTAQVGNAVAELIEAKSRFEAIRGETEQRVAQKEAEVGSYLASARNEAPFYRLTKNQFGNLTEGMLDNFAINGAFSITFSLHREIFTGVQWQDRDEEEKEIMTAMGLEGVLHFEPRIRVLRMQWSGWSSELISSHSFFQQTPGSGKSTCASYAKLVSGAIYGHGFEGINSDWGLCGSHYSPNPGRYIHCHPSVTTASGEVLFVWYGVVAGHVPLYRANPKWGFYPHISSSNAMDTSI